MGAILRQNNTELLAEKNGNGQHVLDGEPRRLEEARAWQQQYCESCKEELGNVVI